jgi:hypothetical protein
MLLTTVPSTAKTSVVIGMTGSGLFVDEDEDEMLARWAEHRRPFSMPH